MKKGCPLCEAKKRREEEAQEREIIFYNEGVPMTAIAKRYNDAFWEVTKGKYKGNLIHTFDVKPIV